MNKVVFEELEIWKVARKYRKRLSKIAGDFPKKEKERLTFDLIDGSRAISFIIAKGNSSTIADNIYSCETAISFAAETMDMLIVAYDEGYIKKKQLKKYRRWNHRLIDTITRYIIFLRKHRLIMSN